MPIFSSQILSGSTGGGAIAVIATASPGTTLHSVATGANIFEDVYLDAYSQATTDRILTTELGGTATTFRSEHLIPAQGGPIRVMAGHRFQSATTLVIRAFATVTGGLLIGGAVNRATP